MTTVKLEDTHREAIPTSRLVDGAATDADSTPTVTVFEQGTAMGYSPTVTNKSTGLYEAAIVCSAANGFEVGKEYTAAVTVVMGGVTGKADLCSFRVVAANLGDGVNVTQWNGTNVATPTTAGVPRVDVKAMEANVVTSTAVAASALTASKFSANSLYLFGTHARLTAQAGGASTITLDATSSSVDDYYVGLDVSLVFGTGIDQTRKITAYNGTTKVATVDRAWKTNPDNTTTYQLSRGNTATASLGAGSISLSTFAADALIGAFGILDSGTAQTATATSIRLRAGALAADGRYKNARIIITSGTGAGQNTTIIGYTGSTKDADVADTWATTPDATSTYVIFAGDSPMAAALATLDGVNVEDSHSLADLVRLIVALVAGEAEDFETDTVRYYGLDGATIRATYTYNDSGRAALVLGTLTD